MDNWRIFVLTAMLILLFVVVYHLRQKKEGLGDDVVSTGDTPFLFRVNNTILAPAAPFSDAMDKLDLPAEVADNFTEWIDKGLVNFAKSQGECGSCWSFSCCGSLSDRFSIATGGKWNSPFGLSEQVLTSCGNEMKIEFYNGCSGAIPSYAAIALAETGVPEDIKCLTCGANNDGRGGGGSSGGNGVVDPTANCSNSNTNPLTGYTWFQTKCDESNTCSLSAANTCPCEEINNQFQIVSGESFESLPKYLATGQPHTYCVHDDDGNILNLDMWGSIPQNVIDANVLRMKKAVYYEGPISVCIRVTSDFFTFWPTATSENFYRYDGRSSQVGGHALTVVSYRTLKDGTKVWVVKNSWSDSGGYGFPDGPQIIDPVTGKKRPKYRGGFYNHIMSENDSYIESNAIGIHPDLTGPAIKKYLPSSLQNLPKDWYNTYTTRDIYNVVTGNDHSLPTPSHSPNTSPSSPTSGGSFIKNSVFIAIAALLLVVLFGAFGFGAYYVAKKI